MTADDTYGVGTSLYSSPYLPATPETRFSYSLLSKLTSSCQSTAAWRVLLTAQERIVCFNRERLMTHWQVRHLIGTEQAGYLELFICVVNCNKGVTDVVLNRGGAQV